MMLGFAATLPGAKPVPTFAEGWAIMIGERCADFVEAALAG